MSDLGQEVADLVRQSNGLTWWQRAVLIMGANIMALIIGGMALSGGKIVWDKAWSTDAIIAKAAEDKKEWQAQLKKQQDTSAAERRTMLDAIAKLTVEVDNLKKAAETKEDSLPPFLPNMVPDQQRILPSADDVETTREQLQQKIDREVFRAHSQ